MAIEYGFGKLEDELLNECIKVPADYNKIKELLEKGADINAISTKDTFTNILSEVIEGREYYENGKYLLEMIKFFLENGFDIHKNNGEFGSECLRSLCFSSYDDYILEIVRLFLDSGVKLVPCDEDNEGPISSVNHRISTAIGVYDDYEDLSRWIAMYEMIDLYSKGLDYTGVYSYKGALGKKIKNVYTIESDNMFYSIDYEVSKHANCYREPIYMEYEDGCLIVYGGEIWVDSNALVRIEGLIDVSDRFSEILNVKIENILFNYNQIKIDKTCYTQPIIPIEFGNRFSLRFSNNHGEQSDKKVACYYEIEEKDERYK